MPIDQSARQIGITTALGPNQLGLRSFSVQEQVSRLFQIEAELCSEDGAIDFDQVVGRNATIRLDVAQQGERYWNGFVSRLAQLGNQGGYARYQATIMPWLWFLTRTADCRIFQNKTVPDIIEEVFKGHGFNDYKLKLNTTYPKWEYCVQYRETDFNFVSRLMEQEGIYYFFEHANGSHNMVLADSISAHTPFPNYAEITFHEVEAVGTPGREVITDWTMQKEAQPIAYMLNDFDFKKPKASLRAPSNVTREHGKAEYEIYDYPGEYLEQGEGQRLADVRLHELQTQYEVLHGQGTARGVAAGCTFKLKSYPRQDQNREYLVIGISLQADAGPFEAAAAEGGQFFSCNFTAIAKAQQFRPSRLTPRPIVQGLQTAIVVGPKGEEIHTENHARVKVQFHWDRYGKFDENSSCWIRVSQPWAGKGWGSMATPRIGQEVVVEFLEGDPDRPLITGRVYNADQPPPYAGGKGVISGLKSKTHKGQGYNEMSMDDTAGKEKINIHAQYDMNTKVEHDRTDNIVHDEQIAIGNNRTESVSIDESISIGNNRTETVAKQESVTIGEDRTVTVGKSDSLVVGTKLSIDAGDEIVINTGSANITMKKDGTIKITGTNIAINGTEQVYTKGGQVVSEADTSHETKGALVKSEGTATNTVKGGVVMLNP
jgi:type VI secretion system secreted protein VgrG